MYTVDRLRHKLSPLEDKEFTAKVMLAMTDISFKGFERRYKGELSVVISLSDAWELLFPETEYNVHDLTILGRSLQALLWERSYLRGALIFTKPVSEVESDGF